VVVGLNAKNLALNEFTKEYEKTETNINCFAPIVIGLRNTNGKKASLEKTRQQVSGTIVVKILALSCP
jgi:hypothetical protein